MNYTKKIARGIGIIFIMGVLANFIAYLVRVTLARNLSPAEYGLFYAVFTVILFFLSFRDLGLSQATVKYISEFRVRKNNNAIKTVIISNSSFQLLSSVILAALFFILATPLSEYYFRNELSSLMLKLLTFYILFSALIIILKSPLQSFQRFKVLSLMEFLRNLIVLASLIIFFTWGFKNIFAPIYAYILASPILFLMMFPFLLKSFPIFKYKITNFKSITKKLFLFGIPVILTGVGAKVIGYMDTLILTYFSSFEQVGIYNVILPSATLFLFLGISVSAVAFPIFSELWAKKDKIRMSEGLKLLHKYAFVITIPLIFTVFMFSSLFINLFFGQEYVSGALALQILLVGVLFYTVAGINNYIISAIGKPKIVTKIILFSALINFVANMSLIPFFGIIGAAIATSLSYLTTLLISTYMITKFIQTKLPIVIWLKITFVGLIFVLFIGLLKKVLVMNPWAELIISTMLAGIVYLIFIYVLKIIDIKEIKRYLLLMK
jgi:O-antigen/teichoic acid export membrane protein